MSFRWREEGRCVLAGWVSAWAIAIFLSSAVLAHLRMAPAAGDCGASCFFAVADEVSPQAKLVFGVTLGLLMSLARRVADDRLYPAIASDAAAALAAMIGTLALLPADWSRGFGAGIFASRFALWPTIIYLACAFVAALIGTLIERSCRRTRARFSNPQS